MYSTVFICLKDFINDLKTNKVQNCNTVPGFEPETSKFVIWRAIDSSKVKYNGKN